MDNTDIFIDCQKRLGMSGCEFAAALGITARSVSLYNTRRRLPSKRTMTRLKELLAKNKVVEAVQSEQEAHILYIYRKLPLEAKVTVDTLMDALLYTAKQQTSNT